MTHPWPGWMLTSWLLSAGSSSSCVEIGLSGAGRSVVMVGGDVFQKEGGGSSREVSGSVLRYLAGGEDVTTHYYVKQ